MGNYIITGIRSYIDNYIIYEKKMVDRMNEKSFKKEVLAK